jgi:L-ascorbate metabolism protein UlaG (beta-lactamase superfamily)
MSARRIRTAAAVIAALFAVTSVAGAAEFERDVFTTSGGPLALTFIGHASFMIEYGGHVIQVDPWSSLADYSTFPIADLVLVTHHHIDHLDSLALRLCRAPGAVIVGTEDCARQYPGITVMRYGDSGTFLGMRIDAVPSYNPPKPGGSPSHPKNICNGYILTAGDKRLWIAGETSVIPELGGIHDIDIAFLPMDGVYNMTPAEAAEAAKIVKPKVVYPYHFSSANIAPFAEALSGSGIEVRVRKMK